MLLTVFVFFIVLSLLVFIHELGHFSVARLIGVKVEEFGFGLPPRVWGKKFKDTIYSINWLPIGGFVKLAGEDEEPVDSEKFKNQNSKNKIYFWARSKKERSAILIAGVTMNFLLAVILTMVLLVNGVNEPSGRVKIEKVQENTPAAFSKLMPEDVITGAAVSDGRYISITSNDILRQTVKKYAGSEVVLNILRSDQKLEVIVIPRKDFPEGQGPLGISINDLEIKKYTFYEAPIKSLEINISRGYLMIKGVFELIVKLFTFQNVGQDVAGPIGIAQVTGEAVKFGWKAVIELMAILSLNLAVLNILPVPALDGGRLLFVFIEKIVGRKVKPAFERQAHQIGMLILLALIVLVSLNDIAKITKGG